MFTVVKRRGHLTARDESGRVVTLLKHDVAEIRFGDDHWMASLKFRNWIGTTSSVLVIKFAAYSRPTKIAGVSLPKLAALSLGERVRIQEALAALFDAQPKIRSRFDRIEVHSGSRFVRPGQPSLGDTIDREFSEPQRQWNELDKAERTQTKAHEIFGERLYW